MVGLRPTASTVVTGWRCSARCSTRGRRGQHWGVAAGTKKDEVERGWCWRSRRASRRTRSSRRRSTC
ncbi:hypothetical protein [Nitrospira sp. Kam-Ns4a]